MKELVEPVDVHAPHAPNAEVASSLDEPIRRFGGAKDRRVRHVLLGEEQGRAWKGVPCPFLDASGGQGRCSVYKQSRPLACRHLINLDRDDLLCKLVDGVEVNVPYLARADAKALTIEVLGGAVRMADIRAWFGVDPVWRLVPSSK